MMKMRSLCAAALLCVLSTHVSAQGVASTSNDPNVALSSAVMRLASTEKSALSDLSADRLVRISTPVIARPDVPQGGLVYTRAALAAMPEATGGEDWKCLSEALYFEARGETVKGQIAVAEVILNRVASAQFPTRSAVSSIRA